MLEMTENMWPGIGFFDFGDEDVVKNPKHVWPIAATVMNIDVTVNAKSQVWVFHDRHFPDYLEWIEFDMGSREMTFVTAGGKIQNLGLTIYPPMDGYVARAKQVCVIMFKDNEIRDIALVPLAVRRAI